MGLPKKKQDKKNYTIAGKPMSKSEFAVLIKDSEESGDVDFEKGINQVEEKLDEYRKVF